jgi:nitrogen regulatory protein PII 2
MKEIIAIIRPKKVNATKKALEELGFPGMTAIAVLGRGRQRGIAGELNYEVSPELVGRSGGMKYVPKRLLSVVVHDDDEDIVVKTIIQTNQTAQIGDGKIFVCPVADALRIRTDENGNGAIL